MKTVLMSLAFVLSLSTAQAFERPFRIDQNTDIVKTYAIGWGVPGTNLDFEVLDLLSEDDLYKVLDTDLVRNYVVDIPSNKILKVIDDQENEMSSVRFSVGSINYGNHYNVALANLAIEGSGYEDALAVVQEYKWTNNLSYILLVNRDNNYVKSLEINPSEMMNDLRNKVSKMLSKKELALLEERVETLYTEVKATKNGEKYNEMRLTYDLPKSDEKMISLVLKVKIKYVNGKLVPQVLSLKKEIL